ncbi:MAG: RDD family protein [Salinarimonadaceae bacterium]|nr:MAG: RDD family protein [Salinarimonadaceae bacterium]
MSTNPVPAYAAQPLPVTDGVLTRRLLAYLIDIFVILGFTLLVLVAILILGVVTFGIGWLLFAIAAPGAAILYTALTMAGPKQSTIGMRFCGLRVIDAASGGPIDALRAAVHALLFYLAISTFVIWAIDIAIGVFRADRRLGRDLVVNLMVVRAVA